MRKASMVLVGLVSAASLAACGGSSGGGSSSSGGGGSAASGACTPQRGDQLVMLTDDKHSQFTSNIVPVVRKEVAKPPLTDALNGVMAALSQQALAQLNKAVSIDKQRPEDAASAFVQQHNLGKGSSGGSGQITVASADFSENTALANVFAQVLKAAGYSTNVKIIGDRALYEPALESGEAQVIPEYAANLTTFLAQKQNRPDITASTDLNKTMQALRTLLAKTPLTALNPADATDEDAFAVSNGTAKKYNLKTLSDLAAKCGGGITLGGPPECHTRSDCQGALEHTYGIKVTNFVQLDESGPNTRSAIKQGRVLAAEVFSSDPDLVQP